MKQIIKTSALTDLKRSYILAVYAELVTALELDWMDKENFHLHRTDINGSFYMVPDDLLKSGYLVMMHKHTHIHDQIAAVILSAPHKVSTLYKQDNFLSDIPLHKTEDVVLLYYMEKFGSDTLNLAYYFLLELNYPNPNCKNMVFMYIPESAIAESIGKVQFKLKPPPVLSSKEKLVAQIEKNEVSDETVLNYKEAYMFLDIIYDTSHNWNNFLKNHIVSTQVEKKNYYGYKIKDLREFKENNPMEDIKKAGEKKKKEKVVKEDE